MKTDQEIKAIIDQHRPLKGATIPTDIKSRLGAAHVAGKYFFTNEPFVIEGSKKLSELGYGVLKLWFRKIPAGIEGAPDHDASCGYPYNSDWNVGNNITLKELAEHPYFATCFDLPFSTFVLSVQGAGLQTTSESAAAEEQEMYELVRFLLEKYRHRDVTFILQNWEGDWMLRGGIYDEARWSLTPGELIEVLEGQRYTSPVPADVPERVQRMSDWFRARQSGVNRARNEAGEGKCKVYHAIEANKVLDCMGNIPGIVSHVLPQLEVDMVSWSCYEALTPDGVDLYKGVEYIKQHMQPTQYMNGQKKVFIGEIGVPEQRYVGLTEKDQVQNAWDIYTAVCLALDIPYLIVWELFCNEPLDSRFRMSNNIQKKEDLMGFWLVRPDNSLSFTGEYFESLLKRSVKIK